MIENNYNTTSYTGYYLFHFSFHYCPYKFLSANKVCFRRSDECIDFTMLCFFLCVYTRTCRNNATTLNFGGGFR
ncbi:Uncharacterized protein FWK35_00008394 [Aphis craccivora]|uniref:Uncharacterized protein n=1 Tax=Aphis craccivora TaxID=307492 RepID=A0A6G0Z919_APHCR|nr:Uncharacterized protein FWK35_00008394 [Aphis craccivora]